MGNDSSKFKSGKASTRSESVGIKGVNRTVSSLSASRATPPAIRVGSMCGDENVVSNDILTPSRYNSSKLSLNHSVSNSELARVSRPGSADSRTSDSLKRKHPMVLRHRQLIQSCFTSPHESIGKRIMKRACEKRADFAKFYFDVELDIKEEIESGIKMYLKKTVANISFMDEVIRLSEEFGGQYVSYRAIKFKVDFFAIVSDATITECMYLDNAVHAKHQILGAFSQFISLMFSSVRDGFYNEMKRMRRSSNSFSMSSGGSFRKKQGSGEDSGHDLSPRSLSPSLDSRMSDEAFTMPGTPVLNISDIEENGFLKPPRSNSMIISRGG
uniref:RGS domain-containing protein n=1 Tax=Rhabditophanes sp. KR3021 TaxID=114890 RepID=A0AC35UD55_9BILA